MSRSFIYGYGFNSDCDEEKLIEFIKTHKDTFCKSDKEKKLYKDMLSYAEKKYDLEDFFAYYSCDNMDTEGIGAVIANIMSRETGIRFTYCPSGDCCLHDSIVFKEKYPWQINESEKELTEEKLLNICKKYMNELGITNSPDYLSLEYYG